MKRSFLSILILFVVLFVTINPVLAETYPNQSENPYAQVGTIVPFERLTWDSISGIAGYTPKAESCKVYTLGVEGYSITGVMIWSYAWNIYWCYNGSTITSLSKWREVWTNYGWSFLSDIYENQSGGVGKTSYWHYAQGDFCFIETWTCVAHSYPWVSQYVYGNGNYSGSAGGN